VLTPPVRLGLDLRGGTRSATGSCSPGGGGLPHDLQGDLQGGDPQRRAQGL